MTGTFRSVKPVITLSAVRSVSAASTRTVMGSVLIVRDGFPMVILGRSLVTVLVFSRCPVQLAQWRTRLAGHDIDRDLTYWAIPVRRGC
jgi:hypothetical protein